MKPCLYESVKARYLALEEPERFLVRLAIYAVLLLAAVCLAVAW